MRDLYQALGVPRGASHDEVKRAFRKLTQKHHPDKNPGDKSAEDRFKEVSQAYDVLGDAERRQLYDEFGEMSLTQGFDAERARAYRRAPRPGPGGGFSFEDFGQARSTSFDDLLSRLFGGGRVSDLGDLLGGRGGRGPSSTAGPDIHGEIEVSFGDALVGVTVPLRIEARDGTSRVLDVKVPQGIADGGKLRLRGQGGAGSPPGDVLLTVKVARSPTLERDGTNLHMRLPVTALEAYRGGPVEVPTPWGTVTLKLPPGSQNGQTLRLRSQGVKHRGKAAGDLLVTLDVRLPPAGDEELVRALERLQGQTRVRTGPAV